MATKILLADDSIVIQKVAQLTFAETEYDVTTVGDGETAFNKINEIRPDVVLLDAVMPKMNGYELSAKLRSEASTKDIPIILITASFEAFDEARAKEIGINDFITKPFNSSELVGRIKTIIEKSSATAQPPPLQEDKVAETVPGEDVKVEPPSPVAEQAPAPPPPVQEADPFAGEPVEPAPSASEPIEPSPTAPAEQPAAAAMDSDSIFVEEPDVPVEQAPPAQAESGQPVFEEQVPTQEHPAAPTPEPTAPDKPPEQVEVQPDRASGQPLEEPFGFPEGPQSGETEPAAGEPVVQRPEEEEEITAPSFFDAGASGQQAPDTADQSQDTPPIVVPETEEPAFQEQPVEEPPVDMQPAGPEATPAVPAQEQPPVQGAEQPVPPPQEPVKEEVIVEPAQAATGAGAVTSEELATQGEIALYFPGEIPLSFPSVLMVEWKTKVSSTPHASDSLTYRIKQEGFVIEGPSMQNMPISTQPEEISRSYARLIPTGIGKQEFIVEVFYHNENVATFPVSCEVKTSFDEISYMKTDNPVALELKAKPGS
jgi:CheY-like chemotaxis protein